MKNFNIFAVFVFIFLFHQQLFSNVNLKLDLETKIQEKIRSVVSPVDPYAQIIVNISLKQISASPPGTGLTVQGFMSTTEQGYFFADDIDSLQIKIISSLNPVPASLQTLVNGAVNIPHVKINTQISQMEKSVKEIVLSRTQPLMKERDFEWRSGSDQLKAFYQLEQRQFYAICLFGALALCAGFVAMLFLKSIIRKEVQNLISLAQNIDRHAEPARLSEQNTQRIAPQILENRWGADEGDRSFIQSLSAESLTALLSDCFWCKENAYAQWIWSKTSPQQRMQVLAKWPYSETYVSSLSSASEMKSYHNHPYYLRPLATWDISQEDLTLWIKRNPSVWSSISPMRQATVVIPLLEKIEFLNAPKTLQVPALPASQNIQTDLNFNLMIEELSEKDELAILNAPLQVPERMRAQIKSLVWTALLPSREREEILAQLSAQQIAEAFIGPQEILIKIKSSLSEKKLKMVIDYSERIIGDRKSAVMNFIVQESLKKYKDSPEARISKEKNAA